MAELLIRLVVDPETRKKNVVIGYESDDDALPMEHEDTHRRLVDALIAGGALSAAELGRVIVERDSDKGLAADAPAVEAVAERPSAAHKT